ncbi:MAG: hypothetical protein AAFN70_19580, partial [Planctomycetota bacterium]
MIPPMFLSLRRLLQPDADRRALYGERAKRRSACHRQFRNLTLDALTPRQMMAADCTAASIAPVDTGPPAVVAQPIAQLSGESTADALVRYNVQYVDVDGRSIDGVAAGQPFQIELHADDQIAGRQSIFAAYADLTVRGTVISGPSEFTGGYLNGVRDPNSIDGIINDDGSITYSAIGGFRHLVDDSETGTTAVMRIPMAPLSAGETMQVWLDMPQQQALFASLLVTSTTPVSSQQVQMDPVESMHAFDPLDVDQDTNIT